MRFNASFVFCFLLALSSFPPYVCSQDKILAIRSHTSEGFSYYDFNGKVLFNTPPGDEPAVKKEQEPFSLGNFYIIDFSSGVLPVESENGSYLLNEKGKKIKQFGFPTNHITPPADGYIRVLSRFMERRNTSVVHYFNVKGEPAFGGIGYWEGSSIKAGTAVVQLLLPGKEANEQTGEWLLIDATGKTIQKLTINNGEVISRIAEEKEDYWKLSFKGNYSTYLYVRPNGEFSSTYFKPVQKEYVHVSKASQEMDSLLKVKQNPAEFKPSYKKLFFDDQGFVIIPSQGKYLLADHHLNEIPLIVDNVQVEPFRFLGKYHVICAEVVNDIPVSFPVINLKTLQSDFRMKALPDNIVDGLMITYTENIVISQTVSMIVNEYGKVIYEPSPENRVFTSVADALPYADQATKIRLKGSSPESLTGIEKLTHLQVFELVDYKETSIPSVSWKELKSLYLYNCPALTVLPTSFRQLKSVTEVTIMSSENIKGLESFLPDWPNLKMLKTDIRLPEGTREKYPNVNFPEVLVEFKMD